jgi:hypothetical protein
MNTKAEIEKQIVKAMERGEDITELESQLTYAEAKEQTDKRVKELAEIASNRLQTKEKADKVVERANTQREAIKALLQARNEVISPLRKALDKAKVLPALQDKSHEQFHDMIQAGADMRGKDGFLPKDFTIPMLQLGDGTRDAYDATRQALYYLQAAHGLLVSLKEVDHKPVIQKADPYD